jgi:gamma-D-glutamyl-L-lysine dipeptidyl-peptidase
MGAKETAAIRVSVAPVLAARSATSEQVSQALLGAVVQVLERSARWARIRMEDDYEGWISTAHLGPELPPAAEWVTMTDLWVNLRRQPDYRMPARTVAFIGTRLPLRERRAGWLGLALSAGGLGWIEEHRGSVHTPRGLPAAGEPEALLATAHRFLGVPYLWGGCSPLGLDCSGFVQLVYRLHGVSLPRDADQQAEVGEPVLLDPEGSGCAPGDAVFFHAEERPEQMTHVGLALGDGRFIHAAGSDRVRINRLVDSPYGERMACARRYQPDPSVHDGGPTLKPPRPQAVVP